MFPIQSIIECAGLLDRFVAGTQDVPCGDDGVYVREFLMLGNEVAYPHGLVSKPRIALCRSPGGAVADIRMIAAMNARR